ncbi:MAG: hypothetical protein EOM20_11600 [Spartobacteria bacterium]|nr:hypothetical protein [Spartobacteria bacterium]
MQSRTFTFELPCPVEQLLTHARREADAHGITFTGDTQSGACSGHGFSGHYTASGTTLRVTVDQKPLFIPWAMIEKGARDYIDQTLRTLDMTTHQK